MTKPIICNSREEILTTHLTAVVKPRESPKSLEPPVITGSHTSRCCPALPVTLHKELPLQWQGLAAPACLQSCSVLNKSNVVWLIAV